MSGTCASDQRQNSHQKAKRLARRMAKKTEINRSLNMAKAARQRAANKIRVAAMKTPRGTARALRRQSLQPVTV